MSDEEILEFFSRLTAELAAVRVVVCAQASISQDPANLLSAIDHFAEAIRANLLASPMPELGMKAFDNVIEATKRILPRSS